MNFVYNKKIFCLLLIKKNFIKPLIIIFYLLFLVSCGLHRANSELKIKANKVGKLNNNSSYIFIYPEFAKDSLKYQAIANNIEVQLKNFGFTKVNSPVEAQYAFAFIINTITGKLKYKTNNIIDTLSYDNIITMNILDNILETKGQQSFIWEAYLINKSGSYTKVMEAYTKEVQQKPNNNDEALDKGVTGFISCSINALFDKRIAGEFQEYYYKCL